MLLIVGGANKYIDRLTGTSVCLSSPSPRGSLSSPRIVVKWQKLRARAANDIPLPAESGARRAL